MLSKLREHTSGWIAKIILGMLVFVFSFFGIESYFMTRVDTSVAKVGDQEISQQDFQDRMNQLRQQAQAGNSQIDASMFNTPEFKSKVLDGLIDMKLLQQANQDLGVTVTSGMIAKQIADYSAFQINGKFDPDTYKAILGQQGMTPVGFEQKVRDDLSLQVLPRALQESALATESDVDEYLRLNNQTRDIRYVVLPSPAADDSSVSEAQAKTWYEAHKTDFMSPETVTVKYLEVKADDMKTDVQPDDAALQARYEQEKSRFVTPAQREVSHILISVPPNATAAQQKKALAKAEKIKSELDKGSDFATLAKQDSDDLGSRRQGGDLGWIEPGMTDTAFDSAAFKLARGTVSRPVLTPEGYHIIWVRDVKPGTTKPLAEVKDQLTNELLGSERERKYNDVAGKLVDLIYQDPNSLQPAAEALGLKVQESSSFTREGGAGIAAKPEVVQAAFSDQVLNQSVTSDPITIGSNDMVVLRVGKHEAARPKPLQSVMGEVQKQVLADRSAKQAKTAAEASLALLRKDGKLQQIAASHELSVQDEKALTRSAAKVPPVVTRKAFKMPHPDGGKPSVALVEMGQGSYALIELDAVHPGDPGKTSKAEREALAGQLQRLHGITTRQALLKVLRSTTKIEIKQEKLQDQQS